MQVAHGFVFGLKQQWPVDAQDGFLDLKIKASGGRSDQRLASDCIATAPDVARAKQFSRRVQRRGRGVQRRLVDRVAAVWQMSEGCGADRCHLESRMVD